MTSVAESNEPFLLALGSPVPVIMPEFGMWMLILETNLLKPVILSGLHQIHRLTVEIFRNQVQEIHIAGYTLKKHKRQLSCNYKF